MKNNIFTKFFTQKKELDIPALQQDLVGWHETGRINTLSHYYDNQYENGYASIQAITKQFFAHKPFAMSANGKVVPKAHIIDVLAQPNADMSGMDFREAMSVMSLVHNKVYIRVHHTGNQIREANVTGLTFLEGVQEVDFPDGIQYRDFTGQIYTKDEVIILKNINPYDLDKGYSTAQAAKRWATLDDYIAAFQTGFFRNGAIPAGIFTIISNSDQEFKDTVRNMQAKHRGADKNNNVMYVQRPIDPNSGQPMSQAQVEWTETSQTNKDLALDKLFEQVNKKIDSAYGVPASMRGDNDNNTYASVRVDQEIFIDNAVRPFATKIWNRFTHELNRVTGGLGYIITVDIETPHIAEEEQAFAEAKSTNVATLISLVNAGSSVEAAVTALGLPDEYLQLKLEKTAQNAPTAVTEPPVADVAEVDNGGEAQDAPTAEAKKLDPLSVECKHCGRYLFKATGTTIIEDMPCPKCKATLNFKMLNPLGDDVTHSFTFTETEPKDPEKAKDFKEKTKETVEETNE